MAHSQHENTAAPALSGVIDLDGTEYGAQASTAPEFARRSYRASADGDVIGAVESHMNTGQPDHRRGHATVLPDPGDETQSETYSNEQTAVVLSPEAPPERPRQGFTGADPTRTAMARRPLLLRLFDKVIADHPGSTTKIEHKSPLAARPRAGLSDIATAQPFAGGSTGTQSEGIGPGRNSFRVLPDAWDALLVNTGGPAVSEANPDPAYSAAAGQSARGRFR